MEKPGSREAKKAKKSENKSAEIPVQESVSEHAEAVALVEKHRDFFEHYAKGKIKVEPAPRGLKTFAFDLEKNTIYINSMFYKKFGFSEEKTILWKRILLHSPGIFNLVRPS